MLIINIDISGYPGKYYYKLIFNNNKLEYKVEGPDSMLNCGKINAFESRDFMNKFIKDNENVINDFFNKYPNINKKNKKVCKINTQFNFVCHEDFRNIYYGFINNLIKDNKPYSNNKIGDFGFLCGNTKPIRLKFIELSKTHKMLEYYKTPMYDKHNSKMITFNDMKKYKYLIDLPGHTYSTKIYSYLHCKRVVFRVKNRRMPFYWEKHLKPNVHYIEVNNNLSNLIEKYKYLENNPDIYNNIVKNCEELISNVISQEKLQYNFLNTLFIKANNI
jgi:hypothetical protein